MAAIERLVRIADLFQQLWADATSDPIELSRQHEHQRNRVLGAGDVCTPAQREHFDPVCGAGANIDVAWLAAVFLHDAQAFAGRKLFRPDLEGLDHQPRASGKGGAQRLLALHQPHFAREQVADARAHALAIAGKIRLIVSEKIGVFLNARNLTNIAQDSQTYGPTSPSWSRTNQRQEFGVQYTLGLKGSF